MGGVLVFDLQLNRPEFADYASVVKPHDNRFLNINLDSQMLSKNSRPRSYDFSKFLLRRDSTKMP